MYSLLIETATNRGIVALAQGDLVVKSVDLPSSQDVALVTHLLCKDAGITLADLTYCVVGIGPGSYTGIRVGVSFAKGIAVALNIPLIPLSGLYGLVSSVPGKFIAALDAKIGGVFILDGILNEGQVQWKASPDRIMDQEFQARLTSVDSLVVIESDWLAKKQIQVECPIITAGPSIDELVRLGLKEYVCGKGVAPSQVFPLYLRKTQAEIEKLKVST